MAVKIKAKKGENEKFDPRGISQSEKSDWKAIKLIRDGKTYVEHVLHADYLIKAKKAIEVKGVDFEVEAPHIKFVEDVEQ